MRLRPRARSRCGTGCRRRARSASRRNASVMVPAPPCATRLPDARSTGSITSCRLRLRRRRRERGLRRVSGPGRLDDRRKIGTATWPPVCAAAEGAAAVAVVVADPDRDGDIVGEADEPGVVLVLAGAGLAGDVGRELAHRVRGAARDHALQHRLELIERDRGRRSRARPAAWCRRDRRCGRPARPTRSRAASGARPRWRSRRRTRPGRSAAPAGRRARSDNSAGIRHRAAPPGRARTRDRG